MVFRMYVMSFLDVRNVGSGMYRIIPYIRDFDALYIPEMVK